VALPLLATVADLEAAGVTGTDAALELALRRASARVRRYTGQDISFVAGDTIEVPGGGRVLPVPQRPLVVDEANPLTVVEIAEFGGIDLTAVEGRDFSRIGNELTRGYPWQSPTRLMGWPWSQPHGVWAPKVRLTYSHGYAEIPDDILDVVLDLAASNLANPHRLRSETVGGESVTYATETIGNAKLTKQHREDLRPYRRAAFTVVPS
jgi:hypothetical protein